MTTTTTFTVTGMTCGHCVAAVTDEVAKLDARPAASTSISPPAPSPCTPTVPVDPAAFAAAVDEAGYEVTA